MRYSDEYVKRLEDGVAKLKIKIAELEEHSSVLEATIGLQNADITKLIERIASGYAHSKADAIQEMVEHFSSIGLNSYVLPRMEGSYVLEKMEEYADKLENTNDTK